MDDIERAIDDGVNVFKGLCKVRNVVLRAGTGSLVPLNILVKSLNISYDWGQMWINGLT
jgi:hypothetical protein